MAESTVSLKLLIDTHGKRIMFAEAGNDCMDFLVHMLSLPIATFISLLSLPIATFISLLRAQGMVGSLANLYESIENLHENYIQSGQNKDTLLKPMAPISGSSLRISMKTTSNLVRTRTPFSNRWLRFPVQLLTCDAPTERTFYRCTQCITHISDDPRAVCPACHRKMSHALPYVAPPATQPASEGGFVKGMATYMVMDDLVVKPMSAISSITLFNKFNIKEVASLVEREVTLGMTEAVKLLKAALQSKNIFTDVFLKGMK